MKLFQSAIFAFFTCLGCIATELPDNFYQPQKKKLIHIQAWAERTPSYLLQQLAFLKEKTPYDGFFLELRNSNVHDSRNKEASTYFIFQNTTWPEDIFDQDIPRLQKLSRNGLKDSFIGTCVKYGDLDWFNDEHWNNLCHNYAIVARVAREGEIAGIGFDPEMYMEQQFEFNPKYGHSYAETWQKARLRGQQWITAIQKEFPQAKIFSLFWASLNFVSMGNCDVNPAIYGNLFIPFMNGVYDKIAPGIIIIDGSEEYGYRSLKRSDFERGHSRFRTFFRHQLLPENLERAEKQTQYSVAVYLDAFFWAMSKSKWDFLPGKPFNAPARYELFRQAFPLAVEFADEYVWTYGEAARWYSPLANRFSGKTISDICPDINAFMRAAKSTSALQTYCNAQVAAKKLKNELRYGSFEESRISDPISPVKHWGVWSRVKSPDSKFSAIQGRGFNNSIGAVASDYTVTGGTLYLRPITVKPGRRYLFRGKVRSEDLGRGNFTINFKNSQGTWDPSPDVPTVRILPPQDAGKWHQCIRFFTVPDNCNAIQICCSVMPQRKGKDQVALDDNELYLLP